MMRFIVIFGLFFFKLFFQSVADELQRIEQMIILVLNQETECKPKDDQRQQ